MDYSRLTLGDLDAILAGVHMIEDRKRSAFLSRLRNLNRLKFPVGVEISKGKTATYDHGGLAQMALALEMAQLGVTPERMVGLITFNWFPTLMAFAMAARELEAAPHGHMYTIPGKPVPMSMFLFFDPRGLGPLQQAEYNDDEYGRFFYGGEGVVRENIVEWTSTNNRISLVNVTAMLDVLAGDYRDDDSEEELAWSLDIRGAFFTGVKDWAEQKLDLLHNEDEQTVLEYLATYIAILKRSGPETNRDKEVAYLAGLTGLSSDTLRKGMDAFIQKYSTRT